MTVSGLDDLVASFTRAIRAMGYYDSDHPVFQATRRTAHEALMAAIGREHRLTLASTGRELLVQAEQTRLNDAPSQTLARTMFELGVVALRLHTTTNEQSLGALMQLFAERPERVRTAGGAAVVLRRREALGVDVLEVDFGALFSGQGVDLGALVQGDPIATAALRQILSFREGGAGSEHDVSVRLESIGGPDSLGAFLDDLLEEAGPEALPGASGHITCDDLADQAVQAYLRSQEVEEDATTQTDALLAQSAAALSAALVRLSPDGRFALLRRLAGHREDAPSRDAAAARVGAQVQDNIIISAVAAALVGQDGDPDAVRAVGDLVRRLRPIEAERRSLLESVDGDMAAAGCAIDGVLWQQMQARAYGDGGLGMLEVKLQAHRERLAQCAQSRLRGALAACEGQDVLHTFAPQVIENGAVRTWVEVLKYPCSLQEDSLTAVQALIVDLYLQGAFDESVELLAALAVHGEQSGGAPALQRVRVLLESKGGPRWSKALLARSDVPGSVMADLLLRTLDEPLDARTQTQVIERLAQLGTGQVWALAQREMVEVSPARARSLMQVAFRVNEQLGLKVTRAALKGPTLAVKTRVIRTLVDHPTREVIALLAHTAGWKGERYTHSLLQLKGDDQRHTHRLQLAAIGALGMSKSPLAVRPLLDLCTRVGLFSDEVGEAVQIGAAQALLTNGTPAADRALEEIQNHKKRGVRDIARRVLKGRR